jgi:hypothetical protein
VPTEPTESEEQSGGWFESFRNAVDHWTVGDAVNRVIRTDEEHPAHAFDQEHIDSHMRAVHSLYGNGPSSETKRAWAEDEEGDGK